MAAFLGNLRNVVIAGFVLALIVMLIHLQRDGWTTDTETFVGFVIRWAAMATIILGIGLASMNHYLVQAYTLDAVDGFTNTAFVLIGIGMWLGTIMWFNVWFVIWPNQQKVLNIGGKGDGLSAEAKAAAGKTALIASRFNTMASIPMLFCMVAASHI